MDVSHLRSFVSTLSLSNQAPSATTNRKVDKERTNLIRTVDELSQTAALMESGNPDEYYDITQRDRKYAAVDAQNGPLLLEKVERGRELAGSNEVFSTADQSKARTGDRFGNVIRGLRRGTESEHRSLT